MALAGGTPDPAIAPELGVDAMLLAEGLDIAGGIAEGVAEANGVRRAAEGLQRLELRPLCQHHAGVPAARPAAADIGLDDGDVQIRLAALQVQRRPQSGKAAADDADIRLLIALQGRAILLARLDRFAQPDAPAFDTGLHRLRPLD